MDSGLGSDEEQRRCRSKEQKQRHNEQLLNGGHCFIDASSLQDEEIVAACTAANEMEQRRTEERRQGALLFQSSIPQYGTMLQLQPSLDTAPDTPFNSIVNIVEPEMEEEASPEVTPKPSLGFFVDLSEVEVESGASEAASSATKNIFSMVIDFEAPKKDMPIRLRNGGKRKPTQTAEVKGQEVPAQIMKENVEEASAALQNNVCAETNNELIDSINEEVAAEKKPECEAKFVRLSDLVAQNPRVDTEICSDFIGARMSKSIPESSWVESPLLMSRSAGYRIAPRPLEPDHSNLSDSTGSQTGVSQRRLGTDLLRMFLEEMDTDTLIHVGTMPRRTIKAHRCILISRCQYFAGTLRGRSLTIDGFSYDSVHFALCHIYSGAAHVPDSISLVELASLADMLSLEGLKEVVAHALKSRHCHHFHSPCAGCLTGVLEVLPLSSAYGLDELYQRCLRWITLNYLRVWPSRAFASLPKELREKCYQQHVIHMSAATVLTTCLSCDRLLVSLPGLKWAEPIVQLGLQLERTCRAYITQHYVAVLPTVFDMEPWDFPRVEEILLNATDGLSLDQECSIYDRCCGLLQNHHNESDKTLSDLLEKLILYFEKCLLAKPQKITKCPSWSKMDPNLRMHIKKLGKFDETRNKPARNEPSRLPRMVANKPTTSSSESSRNSSPATSQTHTSPSLRRSLLLAARAPQVPPSPSAARRISTLTLPTQASAAKSAPARHIKPQPQITTKNRPVSAPTNIRKPTTTRISSSVKTPTTTRKFTDRSIRKENPKPDIRKEDPKPNIRKDIPKPSIRKDIPKPDIRYKKSTAKNASSTSSESRNNKVSTKEKLKNEVVVPQSPSMQRSSTFLKEEPTVLNTIQNQSQC